MWSLFIAVIPALVFGGLFKKYIDAALANLVFIACVMVAGGIVLLFIDKFFTENTIDEETKITNKNAFIIGCFQVLSIIFPGLSRSAATIIGGMSQKLTRSVASEFSFFLAVPTMFAATGYKLFKAYKERPELLHSHANIHMLLIGNVIAFIVAMIAIKFFIGFLQKHGFKLFGYYRILAGIILLLLIWKGVIGS